MFSFGLSTHSSNYRPHVRLVHRVNKIIIGLLINKIKLNIRRFIPIRNGNWLGIFTPTDNSHAASVDQASGCSGEPSSEAPRPEAGASNKQPTPGCSGGASTSAPLAATNHHQSNSTVNQTFARYLILSHSDRSKDITKINPYAIEKAMSVLIAGHFTITRYERTKLIEVYVRSKRQSDTLVAATELDCTEFKIPITVTKHRTKNTSKGVVHCDFFADTPKSKLLADMAADKVIDIYRFKETKNGVEIPKDSYCLTFDSEVPPKEMLMGYIPSYFSCRYMAN